VQSKIIYSFISLILITIIWISIDPILAYFTISFDPEVLNTISMILESLVVISGALFINQLINYFIWIRIFLNKLGTPAPKLLKDLTLILLLIIAITFIIGYVFNQPLTGFWATSGVTALVLGFALRNMILDLFSGIAINIEKPYKIGDWIEIHQRMATEKVVGEVIEISWRATHIKTEDNSIVLIPNSILTTMVIITNYWEGSPNTRYELFYTLDFSITTEKAKRVILAGALEANERDGFVKDRVPQVLVDKTDELGVVYKVRYWITPWRNISPSQARDEVNSKILKHIWHAGLTLAYPKEDIYYEKMPKRHLDDDRIKDRITLISKIDLFSDLNKDEKDQISKNMIKRNVNADEMIVKQGENGSSMFILMEGLLDVYVRNHKEENIKVSQISPSEHFGEMSLLTGETRSASIRAAVDSVVYEIKKESFNELLALRKEIVEIFGSNITRRKLMNDRILKSIQEKEQQFDKNKYQQNIIYKIKDFFGIN
jgi:small-conductance mechanosensitive channel/CRP-like cAMP-binding protein